MDPEPRVGGGGSAEGRKKKSDPHQFEGGSGQRPACCNCATSDEFEMCPCPGENAHATNSNAKLFRRTRSPSEKF